MKHSISVLLADGRRLNYTQREGDSADEFRAWVQCAIEDKITGKRGAVVPAGVRWAEWDHYGHPLRKFWSNGLGTVLESTGNQYVDRRVRVPGFYDINAAARAIGAQGNRTEDGYLPGEGPPEEPEPELMAQDE